MTLLYSVLGLLNNTIISYSFLKYNFVTSHTKTYLNSEMKRRNFLRNSAILTAAGFAGSAKAAVNPAIDDKEIYEWRVYHFKNSGQKQKLDRYYENILLPILNGFGVKVGAFSEYGKEEPPKGYYLLVFPSLSEYQRIKKYLWSDISFLERSKDYFEDSAKNPTYLRFETYLMEAFSAIPQFRTPEPERGLFELRTYESNTEEAGQRKVRMFNNEELELFDEVGLHPTFFGEILAGPQMPALMYMLWFRDMAERNANWNTFRDSPKWKRMSSKKEYKNTVSVVNKEFLLPMPYSQI